MFSPYLYILITRLPWRFAFLFYLLITNYIFCLSVAIFFFLSADFSDFIKGFSRFSWIPGPMLMHPGSLSDFFLLFLITCKPGDVKDKHTSQIFIIFCFSLAQLMTRDKEYLAQVFLFC